MRTLLITSALLALAACSTTAAGTATASAAPSGRDCFHARDINGYGVIDDHHVRLTIGASRKYILTTNWDARDLDWSQRIAVRSPTDWICTGNGLGVEVIGGQPVQHYPISDVSREPPPPAQGS